MKIYKSTKRNSNKWELTTENHQLALTSFDSLMTHEERDAASFNLWESTSVLILTTALGKTYTVSQ